MATILVIDDDKAILDVITEILTLDGNEVIVAEDGIQGLEQFKNQLPDLVITDLAMPSHPAHPAIAISRIPEYLHFRFVNPHALYRQLS